MTSAGQIVAIVTVLASLYLVTRGFRADGNDRGRLIKLALIWALIIVGSTLFLAHLLG